MSHHPPDPMNDEAPQSRVVKVEPNTLAARFNRGVYLQLGHDLKSNPELDLRQVLTERYSEDLQRLVVPMATSDSFPRTQSSISRPPVSDNNIPAILSVTDACTVIYPPSASLSSQFQTGKSIAQSVLNLLSDGEILYSIARDVPPMTLKIAGDFIVKITSSDSSTEHESLAYLQEHLPSFPAPRPHGLIKFKRYHYLFTSFIPGSDLSKIWPTLDDGQKEAISNQLTTYLANLRCIPFAKDAVLGAVSGTGCQDGRRHVRASSKPIRTEEEFRDFIFSGAKYATQIYTGFLREFLPPSEAIKIVFTHGDFRLANVRVKKQDDGTWAVAGIIDWEASGFYPEYWESIKMTNNLSPLDKTDWYRYLPNALSPYQYPLQWLVDRVLDPHLKNSQ